MVFVAITCVAANACSTAHLMAYFTTSSMMPLAMLENAFLTASVPLRTLLTYELSVLATLSAMLCQALELSSAALSWHEADGGGPGPVRHAQG